MIKNKRNFLFLILLIPAVAIIPYINTVPFNGDSQYSDLINTHLPNAIFIQHSISTFHQIPLWNTQILSGYPFAGDPLSGLWYPLTWFVNLAPEVSVFNILLMAHLIIMGLGMYRFLRDEGLDHVTAIFGAVMLELMPKVWAHYAAGHMTLLFSLAWLPWLLHFTHQRIHRRKGTFLPSLEILFFSLIILADVRGAVYAGLLWFIINIRESIRASESKPVGGRIFRVVLKSMLAWSIQLVICFFVCAVFLLPFFELLQQSTRVSIQGAENLIYSLPPERLINILIPNMGGFTEWVIYPGVWTVIALVIVIATPGTMRKKNLFWFVLLFSTLIFALGANLPGVANLLSLPGANLIRVPPRFLFISCLAFTVLSSNALQYIMNDEGQINRWVKRSLAALLVFLFVFCIGYCLIMKTLQINMVWAPIAFTLFLLLLAAMQKKLIPKMIGTLGIFLVVFIDLMGVNFASIRHESLSHVINTDSQISAQLPADIDKYRIYSPSFSISQTGAALLHLEMANGVNPMLVDRYAQYFSRASGVEMSGYTVTLPALATGDLAVDNINSIPDLMLLGELNVKYLVASFSIRSADLIPVHQGGRFFVYENPFYKPRAWIESLGSETSDGISIVESEEVTPNKLTITAEGPGLLVTSDINYPGWEVSVDGKPGTLIMVDDLFRGVELERGNHSIEFRYVPASLRWGIAITVFTLFSLSFNSILTMRKYNFHIVERKQ